MPRLTVGQSHETSPRPAGSPSLTTPVLFFLVVKGCSGLDGQKRRISSTCCWRKGSSRQRNKGWFLRPSGPVSWSGSSAQDASDLCVGASPPILLFFPGGGVALHERLVGILNARYSPVLFMAMDTKWQPFFHNRIVPPISIHLLKRALVTTCHILVFPSVLYKNMLPLILRLLQTLPKTDATGKQGEEKNIQRHHVLLFPTLLIIGLSFSQKAPIGLLSFSQQHELSRCSFCLKRCSLFTRRRC